MNTERITFGETAGLDLRINSNAPTACKIAIASWLGITELEASRILTAARKAGAERGRPDYIVLARANGVTVAVEHLLGYNSKYRVWKSVTNS